MVTSEDIFPVETFSEYRAYAREKGYCDPFVPWVGESYGSCLLPKFVYCGVAARWTDHVSAEGDDAALYRKENAWCSDFIAKRMNGSAFWGLFDQVLGVLDVGDGFTLEERRRHAVWTNLSKLGLSSGVTAPPDNDRDLRAMDARQVRREIEMLAPDLMLCVSGSKLIKTGNAAFEGFEPADFQPALDDTLVKRLPTGGWLYWTMHPNYKPLVWGERVLGDLRQIASHLQPGGH